MPVETYDVIVVGGGPIGLAAAYYCKQRPNLKNKKILVLEQFPFFNQRGSSADFCRMFRAMYSEEINARLALDTFNLWNALEPLIQTALGTNQPLIDDTDPQRRGLLVFGVDTPATQEGSLTTMEATMSSVGSPARRISLAALGSTYPFRDLPPQYSGLYHPVGGTMNIPDILRGLHALCGGAGIDLRDMEAVEMIDAATPGTVRLETRRSGETFAYETSTLILCPGAYANNLLKMLGVQMNLQVWEATFAYYQVRDAALWDKCPMWFQFDFPPAAGGSKLFYGFPPAAWARPGYVRVAVDFTTQAWTSPEQRTFVPSVEDIHLTMNFVKDHLRGVDPEPTQMATCLVPLVSDGGFVLDRAPGNDNILICTAGWAFKFVAAFGLILSQLAAGETPSPLHQDFLRTASINRRGVLAGSPPTRKLAIRPGVSALLRP